MTSNRYGYNSNSVAANTISAAFAGYAGFNIMGFLGSETVDDAKTLQYISGAVCFSSFSPPFSKIKKNNNNKKREQKLKKKIIGYFGREKGAAFSRARQFFAQLNLP